MRIVFMGNPGFAVPSLRTLHNSSYDVIAVVTNPDKEQGRGQSPKPTAVAVFAREHNIPLIQPDSLKSELVASELKNLKADLFVIVAFKILPANLLQIPKLCCINLHGSLLPKYRGAAPIQWALMNGDSITGLSTFILAPKVDTGDLLLKREVVIYPDDDYGSLSRRMSHLGASLLKETVDRIELDTIVSASQDSALATRAPKIKPEMCQISWDRAARQIQNQIRALSPVPGAYTTLGGRRLKLFRTAVSAMRADSSGKIVSINKKGFVVSCGDKSLEIFEVQLEGKRRMLVKDFLLGSSLKVGEKLGS